MKLGADDSGLIQNQSKHHDTLVRLAADALQAGQNTQAFYLSDRRCRLFPRPQAHVFLLRSEALARLGHAAAARRDVENAFAIDPTNPLVSSRALRSSDDELRQRVARWILASPRSDRKALIEALQVLFAGEPTAVGVLQWDGDLLMGWVAWDATETLTMRIALGENSAPFNHTLISDKSDPLASIRIKISRVSLPLPRTASIHVDLAEAGLKDIWVDLRRMPHPLELHKDEAKIPTLVGHSRPATGRKATIIVPLYDDPEITRRCLSCLGAQTKAASGFYVILVNDNRTNADLTSIATEMKEAYGFEVLTNTHNLGFVESVNRALIRTTDEDVVLLNADVLLPSGALDRLHAHVKAHSGIGTITPFSNNGELTSFPDPFQANSIEDLQTIARIDQIAARVNKGRVVDIPNGIGFCLYITRACLEAVGPLSGSYLRGYYEDVDFCLRAGAVGFRNVCATDIYVGHKGGSSFKNDKRALVMRNLKVLSRRFPAFEATSKAFILADPLRDARALIEIALARRTVSRLVVTRADQTTLGLRRARHLSERSIEALVLTLPSPRSTMATIRAAAKRAPQSLQFPIATEAGLNGLFNYLDRLGIETVEIADRQDLDDRLLLRLRRRGWQLFLLFSESPVCSPNPRPAAACSALAPEARPCPHCVNAFKTGMRSASLRDPTSPSPHSLFSQTDGVIPLNAMANAIALRYQMRVHESGVSVSTRFPTQHRVSPVLGILYPRVSVESEVLILSICHSLTRALPGVTVIVIGDALDDLRLMTTGPCFVTGAVADDDYDDLLVHYEIGALFTPDRWGAFGLIDHLSRTSQVPKAFFDWSFGTLLTEEPDLAIDPRICDAKAIQHLVTWCQKHMLLGKRELDLGASS